MASTDSADPWMPKLSKFELDVEILVDETDWRGEANVVEFMEIVENNLETISRLSVVATRAENGKRLNLQVGLCCLGSLQLPHTHEINPCTFKRSNSSLSRRFLCLIFI